MMLKAIIVFVLFYFFEQNYAFALPINADNVIEPVEAQYPAELNDIYGRSGQKYFPESPFIVTPGENNIPYPLDFPQFNTQFMTNGLQSDFTAGLKIPFSSGNLINPSGFYDSRDVGQNADVPQSYPQFKTETFVETPTGQNHYENNKLVEQIPNTPLNDPSQMVDENGFPVVTLPQTGALPPTLNNIPPPQQVMQNPNLPQQLVAPIQQPQQVPVQQQVAPIQQPQQVPVQQQVAPIQQPQPPVQQQYQPPMQQQQYQIPAQQQLQPQGQQRPQPQNFNNGQQVTPQMPQGGSTKPIVTMSAVSAGSSTFTKVANGQPPQVTEAAGISNINYNSAKPNPLSGNYVAVGGHTPNAYDPNQGYYAISEGTYPNPQSYQQQQNMLSNPRIQPNKPFQQQAANPQIARQYSGNTQNYPHPNYNQNYPSTQQISPQRVFNTLNGHFNQLGQLSQHVTAPINELVQVFPRLIQEAAYEGLQITKMPFDMIGAALDALNADLGNVRFNQFAQVPTQGGRAVVRTIQDIINEMQTHMQPQPQQVSGLARRAPEPWMNSYYDSIPYDSAQQKISEMKNNLYNRFQTLTFPQLPAFVQNPQLPSFPQNPILPQSSSNGEPVVKMFSSSVSESTQSSSKNGAPPEVAHQAFGNTYNYDSTKTDDPFEGNEVAMRSYIPNASDSTKGIFEAYENSYPQKSGDD